ncbi:MAG: AMP-binding protein [Polyangiales bacterium]
MIAAERYQNLGELLWDALIQYKSQTALIEADRKRERRTMSYLELKKESAAFAATLKDLGVNASDRVAIVMSNQSNWIIAALGVFFRGAVLVPIDYKLSADDQLKLVEHSGARVLITEYPAFRPLAEHLTVSAIVSEVPEKYASSIDATRFETAVQHAQPIQRPEERQRDDVACIVYSSGTGGAPKGCQLTHENYLSQYTSLTALFPLQSGDRYFSILPTNHAIDFMCGFVGPLAGGATVVHQRTLRPEFINHSMKHYAITHIAVVPLLLEAFETRIREQLDEKTEPVRAAFDLLTRVNASLTSKTPKHALSKKLLKPVHDAFGGHLKLVFCGGAFVDRERAQFFYDLGIPVVIGYGLTEACTVLTVNDLKPFRPDSVGVPLQGVEIEIRGSADGERVGEVWAKSPTVMRGYLDDAEQTDEVLIDGWLRTGDLGYLDASGHLHLVGRSKNMIVTAGGKNIYPEDIENAFNDLPCDEMVVFAANYVWPGGKLTDESLVAVVRGMEDPDPAALFQRYNQKLPDFKRIRGLLRWESEFPRTASMKVKRPVLAEELRAKSSRDQIEQVMS